MSDGYFEGDDDFDSAFLNEVDAIEASQLTPSNPSPIAAPSKPKPVSRTKPPPTQSEDQISDSFDTTFDVDVDELERLDEFIADSYAGKAKPVAGPSSTLQTTLDGKILPVSISNQASRSLNKTKSNGNNPFGRNQSTKQWDNTAFAQTGWISTKNKARDKQKGKDKRKANGEDGEDDGIHLEFEQFPAPFVSGIWVCDVIIILIGFLTIKIGEFSSPPPPMKLKPDLLAARTWIYPLNQPRRDYQFNIARRCLFQNTLVALPTGLGKTFIAGVVMLNYYRWFPEGRIVFTAPTKPLVAQQVEACHQVCGIPGSDAAELTGEIHRSKRAVAWTEKRVLYMTPQTLVKDFIAGSADPQDIVLVVIDEAHRGTGDYAYAQLVRYMMAKNPHHRILALSATPGNNAEAVQTIVDSLHISHIEIRNEESQDLRAYVLKKTVELHVIKLSESLKKVRDFLSKVMQPLLNRLRGCGLVYTESPVMLHPFACTSANKKVFESTDKSLLKWAFGYLKVLGCLARAMGYLMETSIRSCYRELIDMQEKIGTDKPTNKMALKKVTDDKNWASLMAELEKQKAHGFDPHPKMDKLVALALKHFVDADAEAAAARDRGETVESDSKVMVFVQFRECVDEIMERLKPHHPLIRPAPFIGQSSDKRGKKGISQKEQLETIRKFKQGEFNVLVSTSIGEEGLDIGEIDEIICYDAQKSSIRMLQRVGRTGRKRQGRVDVLLAEQREERNWEKSQDNYEDVQYTIISGNQLTLFDDVERLVPGQPACLQTEMPIEVYVRSPQKEKKTKDVPVRKRKRNDDINRNIPLGASTGFVAASELRPKTKRKKAAGLVEENDADSDSDDAEIAAGLGGITSTPTKMARSKKSKVNGVKQGKATGKGTKSSRSKLDFFMIPDNLEEDDDDVDIQVGLQHLVKSPSKPPLKVESSDSDLELSAVRVTTALRKNAIVSDDDDSSPPPLAPMRTGRTSSKTAKAAELDSSPGAGPSRKPSTNWLLENSSDIEAEVASKSPSKKPLTSNGKSSVTLKSASFFESAKSQFERSRTDLDELESLSLLRQASTTANALNRSLCHGNRDITSSPEEPLSTYAVRAPVKGRRVKLPPSSPQEGDEQTTLRRLVRWRSPSPVSHETKPQTKKRRKTRVGANLAIFDMEAIHSGGDVSEGASDVDMLESEGDRQFLQEPGQTQVALSYNQTAAYRMGLMTQMPDGVDGPQFLNKPNRVGQFAGGRTQVPRLPAFHSSPQRNSEPDEYHMGSFVVDDDEPITYSNSSEP